MDNLRKDFPDAEIDYLTELPSKPGLTGLKNISNVLILNRKSFWSKIILAYRIRKEHYDLVLDLFANPTTAQLTYFSGAKYRAGFPYRGRKYAYNLLGPEERGKYHAADLHREFLKSIGLSHSSKELHYFIDQVSKTFAEKYLLENFSRKDFIVGICPTGGWASKKCDPDKFAEIADAVRIKFNAKILILWGKSDESDAKLIHSILGSNAVIAPSTSIQEMAALISRCDILIANDSGPMHIATAVGTPVLSMHGPTSPYMQGPYGDKHEWIRNEGLDCIECNLLDCPRNNECFRDLEIDKVLDKIHNLIVKNNLGKFS